MVRQSSFSSITNDVRNEECEPLSQDCLSEWLVIPAYPILFGLFQFVYFTNRSIDEFKQNIGPDFVCFNAQECPMLLPKIVSIEIINGLTCCHPSNLTDATEIKDFNDVLGIFSYFDQECFKKCINQSCINSSYFHCNQSMKCIPYHRAGDGIDDCYFGENESFNACQLNDSNRFKCPSNANKCLSQVVIGNGGPDCPLYEDEMFTYTKNFITLNSFPNLCNYELNYNFGCPHFLEMDETNCHLWPCNNAYTHCDQYWHCLNGVDKLNCPDTKCSFNEYECENEQFELSYCIPFAHMYEKYLNPCNDTDLDREVYFYNGTMNITEHYFSWNNNKCVTLDRLCRIDDHLQTSLTEKDICFQQQYSLWMHDKNVKLFQDNEYPCHFKQPRGAYPTYDTYFFKAARLGYLPKISTNLPSRDGQVTYFLSQVKSSHL